MAIMYVDDSGSPSHADKTNYFILSGVIVSDDKVKPLQRAVFEYQQSNFTADMVDSEIHTHDMYKSKGMFRSISLTTKTRLLDSLYAMIETIDCAGISIVVDKSALLVKDSTRSVLGTAWQLLLEEYDAFLSRNSSQAGRIMADKSCGRIQQEIINAACRFTEHRIACGHTANVWKPVFADSVGVYGIQLADAFAYCTLKHKMGHVWFSRYWQIIRAKLGNGSVMTQNSRYREYP